MNAVVQLTLILTSDYLPLKTEQRSFHFLYFSNKFYNFITSSEKTDLHLRSYVQTIEIPSKMIGEISISNRKFFEEKIN